MVENRVKAAADAYRQEVSQSIRDYEVFIEEKLKPELQQMYELRDTVYAKITQHLNLRRDVQRIRNLRKDHGQKDLRTRIPLEAADFMVNAYIPDTEYIYIKVGYGFHVQFSLDEAEVYITRKIEHLESQADEITKDLAKVKANIRVMLGHLDDLMTQAQVTGVGSANAPVPS
eukprot:Clim_evm148s210 gene=Clim_evmTU148s210